MFPELTRDDVFRIETARLWLRWPRLADAAAIARQAGEKAVAEMTANIPSPMTEAEATAFVLGARQANADGEALVLALTPQRRPQDVIGVASIVRRGEKSVLGYWLAMPYWGQGLATEAAQAIVDASFGLAALPVLSATVVPYNDASRRVLKKCGFAHVGGGLSEAPARGGPQAVDFFRLDRSTWAALKGWREPRFQRNHGGEEQMQQMMVAAQ
jgi:RimJ/RimL family protein N-acetyltransferase